MALQSSRGIGSLLEQDGGLAGESDHRETSRGDIDMSGALQTESIAKDFSIGNDYTGVATRDLAALIEKHLPTHEDFNLIDFASLCGYKSIDQINRIRRQERQWVGIDHADRICDGFNLILSHELTVIPAAGRSAAVRMAKDSYTDIDGKLWADLDTLAEVADELEYLRYEVLGDPTPEQQAFLDKQAARSRKTKAA